MELKTKIRAEEGKQEIFITREFDLPVDLLFKAFIEPDLVEQWMGTKVIKLASEKHGAYHFETTDPKGKLLLRSSGVIHDIELNRNIIRTFEMENTPFPVQLEYLDFEQLTDHSSRLNMHVIYRSVEDRDAILKLRFEFGINMAHNKLQETMDKLK